MSVSESVAIGTPIEGDASKRSRAERARTDTMVIAALAGITALGAALRIVVAHQSVFADELSTYWISVSHGLSGMLRLLYSVGRIQHAEITPPLSFLASWVTTRFGHSPELLRLPALLAGTAAIPLVFLLGQRAIGRGAALLAAALTSFSPFMIYYSAEARAYGLMMFLVVAAILSMLLAIDTGRTRYWALFALCSAASFCTHYTCVFVLGVALLWALWSQPQARRPALLATAGAVLLVVPWIPGLVADLRSPTVKILSALSPFTATAVRVDIQHWALGYPYTVAGGLKDLPGIPALVLLAVAAVVTAAGLGLRARCAAGRIGDLLGRRRAMTRTERRVLLFVALMLATPVGEILASVFGNHIVGVRDLAASWPFLALTVAAAIGAAGPRLSTAAAVLTVIAFALGAAKMLEPRFQRPDYRAAANYISAVGRPGDAVVDETGALSPGPLTGLDVSYHDHLPLFRAMSPAERDHPFTVFDPFVSQPTAVERAISASHGHRVFVVAPELLTAAGHPNPAGRDFGPGYRLITERRYEGIEPTIVAVYAPSSGR